MMIREIPTMSEPIKRTPRKRLEEREADILTAAAQLFAKNGFHSTTTRQVATTAGVSEGTVFHYFKNKNALLEAILNRFYTDLSSNARKGVQEIMGTRERFLFLAENHIRFLSQENFLLMRSISVYFSVCVETYLDYKHSYIYQLNRAYTKVFDSVIKEGVVRGELYEDLELSIVRDLFFGGLEYGARSMLAKNGGDNIKEQAQRLTQPLWASIQVHSPQPDVAVAPSVDIEAFEQVSQRLEAVCARLESSTSNK
jgi:TetR/AcrR family transcriptional regulator, fatty acid metabolism regulator protein